MAGIKKTVVCHCDMDCCLNYIIKKKRPIIIDVKYFYFACNEWQLKILVVKIFFVIAPLKIFLFINASAIMFTQ